MSLLKTALKANGTAVAAAGDSSGNAFIKHIWESEISTVLESAQIRDTADHYGALVNLNNWGTFSLRVANTLKDADGNNISCHAKVQFDQYNTSYNVKDASGQNINIELPYGYIIITPEDYPFFNYLASLHLMVAADVIPTSGTIEIVAVKKR